MARGRKPKATTEAVKVDHAKLLKQFEQEQQVQLETLYKDLANIRHLVDSALTQIGFMDECDNLSQASFKAGRAYGPLDKANDKLEEMLENMYEKSDFDHWDDVINEI
jgi:hypothetical protein